MYFVTDINECTENSDVCDSNAICTNTVGSYYCICKDGTQPEQDGTCRGLFTDSYNVVVNHPINRG